MCLRGGSSTNVERPLTFSLRFAKEELDPGGAGSHWGAGVIADGFEEYQDDEAGDWQMATPWMEGGDLHVSDVEEMCYQQRGTGP